MTVYDKQGHVLRTAPVADGGSAHPSKVGTFTVTAKHDHLKITSVSGSDTYDLDVHWVLTLDAGGPQLYAMPWTTGSPTSSNQTHGDVGMSTDVAQWLYNQVAVGDRIQIR